MKNLKKITLAVCTMMLLIVSGCGNNDKEEVKKEEKTKLVVNDVYEAPKKANEAQIKLFNRLSKAINEQDSEEEIAKLVACNFAFDFFTLSNKEDGSDVGGLTYLPENYREEFSVFAQNHYYNSYATIVKQYDKDSLPTMAEVKVEKTTPSALYVGDITGDGYMIELTAKYENTELSNDALKTSMTIQVLINDSGRAEVIGLE